MKMTTLNLEGFTDWEERKPAILEYLRATNSDVVLFQEVVFLPDISPYNQAQILNQVLGYEHEHSSVTRLQPSSVYATYREGLAMFSRYPVTRTDTLVLKKETGDEHQRIVQLVDIQMDGHIVKLANVHFSLTDTVDYATAHLKETLEIITARNEERIIAGDFNIDHLEALANVWADHYKASTEIPYISFPAMNKRNDYVLIPKSYVFADISTSDDTLSDHRAVTVEIEQA